MGVKALDREPQKMKELLNLILPFNEKLTDKRYHQGLRAPFASFGGQCHGLGLAWDSIIKI